MGVLVGPQKATFEGCEMSDKVIVVVSAVIQRDSKYLITQRMEKAVLPLLWEFPGGRVETDENPEEALSRELKYRLGLRVQVGELISVTQKDYSDYAVELHLYACEVGAQEPQPLMVKDARWVASDDFSSYDFPPADKESMDRLLFGE